MTRSLFRRAGVPVVLVTVALTVVLTVMLASAGSASGVASAAAGTKFAATFNGRAAANTVAAQPRAHQSRVESGLLTRDQIRQAARRFGNSVGFAVVDLAGGPVRGVAAAGAPYAWSTTKVLIVAQLLIDRGGPRGLTGRQRRAIRLALYESSNEAAAALNADLKRRHGGPEATAVLLTRMLRRTGDVGTRVRPGSSKQSNYGMTVWSASNQVRFMAALARGCVLDPESTRFLLSEMGHVVASQSWGLGRARSRAYKGGWAQDNDGHYMVRQVGLLRARDGHEYAVAITGRPHDGSFASGQQLNTQLAKWIRAHVRQAPIPVGCTRG